MGLKMQYILDPRAMEARFIFLAACVSWHSIHPVACNRSPVQVIQQIDAAEEPEDPEDERSKTGSRSQVHQKNSNFLKLEIFFNPN